MPPMFIGYDNERWGHSWDLIQPLHYHKGVRNSPISRRLGAALEGGRRVPYNVRYEVSGEGLLGRVNRSRTYRALEQGLPKIEPFEETPIVDQREKGVFRRHFGCSWAELFVWYEDDKRTRTLIGFQLCYGDSHALTWTTDREYSHTRIDQGGVGGYKGTPILVANGAFDSRSIAELFLESGKSLEPVLAALIYEKLKGFPQREE